MPFTRAPNCATAPLWEIQRSELICKIATLKQRGMLTRSIEPVNRPIAASSCEEPEQTLWMQNITTITLTKELTAPTMMPLGSDLPSGQSHFFAPTPAVDIFN